MKTKALLILMLMALGNSVEGVPIGASRDEVLKKRGEPRGRMMLNEREVLSYPDGNIIRNQTIHRGFGQGSSGTRSAANKKYPVSGRVT